LFCLARRQNTPRLQTSTSGNLTTAILKNHHSLHFSFSPGGSFSVRDVVMSGAWSTYEGTSHVRTKIIVSPPQLQHKRRSQQPHHQAHSTAKIAKPPMTPTYCGTGAPHPPRVWRAGRGFVHILLKIWRDLQRMTKN
jgi:hypothetical protein